MERKFKKLDAAKIAELKKFDSKPIDKDELIEIAGGNLGPSSCPVCGGTIRESTWRIQGGPESGCLEVVVYCTSCSYEECWVTY